MRVEGRVLDIVGASISTNVNIEDEIFCCDEMKFHINQDKIILYNSAVREYSLLVRNNPDGFDVLQNLNYCPFCGAKLPTSLRDEWFDDLEKLGIDDPFIEKDRIPKEYKSDKWWKEKKL